jgi:hypothetical protein
MKRQEINYNEAGEFIKDNVDLEDIKRLIKMLRDNGLEPSPGMLARYKELGGEDNVK